MVMKISDKLLIAPLKSLKLLRAKSRMLKILSDKIIVGVLNNLPVISRF